MRSVNIYNATDECITVIINELTFVIKDGEYVKADMEDDTQ